MKHLIYLPYDQAHPLIEEGDVLLCRGKKWFSFFIKQITQSPYSHVGLASWHNGHDPEDILEIVEFHLSSGGGVAKNLKNVAAIKPNTIDVYRPSPYRIDLKYDEVNGVVAQQTEYNGKAVTDTMRGLTALHYSLLNIGMVARGYMFGLRLLNNVNLMSDDSLQQSGSYVCSTSVAHSANKNGWDFVKNKSDSLTEPGDLANSPLLNYLFSIE